MIMFFKSCYSQCRLFFHLLASYIRLIRGVWKISKLAQPVVTVFGGSKLEQEHPYAKKAHELGRLFISHDVSIITGGGPGIMEAANCGAYGQGKKARSVGISVHGLERESRNACSDEMLVVKHFFTRKWLLTRYAQAFIVFPGGFGTLDELFEVATLMQVERMAATPIVLIGRDYWKPLLQWVDGALREGLILQRDADFLFVTDDVQEAFSHVQEQIN